MPEKTSKAGRSYSVDGKAVTWPTEDGSEVRIPLRLKLKVLRALADREMNASAMFAMLEQIIPEQADALDEMDLHEFEDMFGTWQAEYQLLTGASLGESSGSSA